LPFLFPRLPLLFGAFLGFSLALHLDLTFPFDALLFESSRFFLLPLPFALGGGFFCRLDRRLFALRLLPLNAGRGDLRLFFAGETGLFFPCSSAGGEGLPTFHPPKRGGLSLLRPADGALRAMRTVFLATDGAVVIRPRAFPTTGGALRVVQIIFPSISSNLEKGGFHPADRPLRSLGGSPLYTVPPLI